MEGQHLNNLAEGAVGRNVCPGLALQPGESEGYIRLFVEESTSMHVSLWMSVDGV